MNKLYKPETKERFLATYDNEQTQKTLAHVFSKSFLVEDILDKDLYNFNLTEIGKVILNANPHNSQTARSFGRFISNYLSWSIAEGLRENNINPVKGIDNSWYDQFVDKTKKIHYSYGEFLQLLEDMQNGQDQAFLFLIWEGIMGKSFIQLRELKQSDIKWETNEVYVKERDENIKVSDDCIRYLEKAINQKIYYTYNGEGGYNEKALVESEFVFRNVQSPRTTASMTNPSVQYTRLNNLKEEMELDYLTPQAIKQSGIIYHCYLMYQEYGKLEYEEFAKLENYELPTVNSSSGYTYLNTTLLKEYVNSENFKTLYNIDIKF